MGRLIRDTVVRMYCIKGMLHNQLTRCGVTRPPKKETYEVDRAYIARTHSKNIEESKKERKDQESMQSSTTPDPGHHMGK